MKRILFIVLMVIGIVPITTAQEDGIRFEEKSSWNKIVKKAKKEKKLVFVDCYTSWCGPCKMLAKNVFTQSTVGAYFNVNFINAKFDCEKGEGIELKKKFAVSAFPTMVFYNPQSDEVEHVIVGAGTADWLLGQGKIAQDRENNLLGMSKKYKAGMLSPVELGNYLKLLQTAYRTQEQNEVAIRYLNSLTPEQLAEKDNWSLLEKNITDLSSAPMQKVMDHISLFYEKVGTETVNKKISSTLVAYSAPIYMWDGRRGEFNKEHYQEAIQFLKGLSFYEVPSILAKMYIAEAFADKDYDRMYREIDAYERYCFDGPRMQFYNLTSFFYRMRFCDNEAAIKRSIDLIEKLITKTDNPLEKASGYDVKIKLQQKIGDTEGAEQSQLEMDKYDKLNKEKNNNVIRAIRME